MTEFGTDPMFEFQITSLISGYNATGYSTLLSVVKCQRSSAAESENNLEADCKNMIAFLKSPPEDSITETRAS